MVSRCIALLGILLLLPGCLNYEIRVDVTVLETGQFRRAIHIQEVSKDRATWKRFQQPSTPPYEMAGSARAGFGAEATLKPGAQHPSGLRVLLESPGEGEEGIGVARGLRAAEGTCGVEVRDLLIGKLYAYHETIALGTDLVAFRRDAERWVGETLTVVIEALKLEFPELDLKPVEENARRVLVPRVTRSLLTIHQAAGILVRDYRARIYDSEAKDWFKHPQVQIILAELEKFGLERKKKAAADTDEEANALGVFDFDLDGDDWEFDTRVVDAFVAPLKGEAARAKVKEALLNADDELSEEFETVQKKHYPEGSKAEDELEGTLIAAIGAYALHGIFDSFDLRYAVRMPGTVLYGNGEIGRFPVLTWHFDDDDLFLVPPHLTAYSFVPAKGVKDKDKGKDKGWTLGPLVAIRDAIAGLEPAQRTALDDLVHHSRREGWLDPAKVKQDHANEVANAYELIKNAVESSS